MCFANTAHGNINLHGCTVPGESLPVRYVYNGLVHSSAGDAINCRTVVRTDGIAFGVDGHGCILAAEEMPVSCSGYDGKDSFLQPWKAFSHLAMNLDEKFFRQAV